MPNLEVYYAIKANPHPAVLSTLNMLGSNFDVQSKNEIDSCQTLGIPGSRLSFGNTIKTTNDIAYARAAGVNYFAQDDDAEINKILKVAPNQKIYIRLDIGQTTAVWPLSGKFGIPPEEIVALLSHFKDKPAKDHIVGISFHVGSQCQDYSMWIKQLRMTKEVFIRAEEYGYKLNLIDLGGGLPTEYDVPVNTDKILKEIQKYISENFSHSTRIFMEPGRFLVGNAGMLVTSVILRSKRNREHWVYIDAGIYHGLMEQSQGINYNLKFDDYVDTSSCTQMNLAGPTCDSYDIIYKNICLPPGIKIGDKIYFKNAGQYTTGYNTGFNGIQGPKTLIINSIV